LVTVTTPVMVPAAPWDDPADAVMWLHPADTAELVGVDEVVLVLVVVVVVIVVVVDVVVLVADLWVVVVPAA
jgi:hypothetical protein